MLVFYHVTHHAQQVDTGLEEMLTFVNRLRFTHCREFLLDIKFRVNINLMLIGRVLCSLASYMTLWVPDYFLKSIFSSYTIALPWAYQ